MPSRAAVHEAAHVTLALLYGYEVAYATLVPSGRAVVTLPAITDDIPVRQAMNVCIAGMVATRDSEPSWGDISAMQDYKTAYAKRYGPTALARIEQLAGLQTFALLHDEHISQAVAAVAARLDATYFLKGAQAAAIAAPYLQAYHAKKQQAKTAQTLTRLRETLPTLRAMAGRPSTVSGALWAVEPQWFARVQALVSRSETPQMQAAVKQSGRQRSGALAIIPISGIMTKGDSLFSMLGMGTNTVRVRAELAEAAVDEKVKKILLVVDSGGGEAQGSHELASDVATINTVKPVEAFVSDLGASAALWSIAGASKITASAPSMVGSVGTLAVLHDESERFQRLGVKTIVASTGPLKGSLAPGAPISDAAVEEMHRLVEGTNTFFQEAMRTGRRMSPAQLQAVSSGGVWLAGEARKLKLVDEIGTLEGTIRELVQG